jgi:chromatin remodeling complex protein RSC6
MVTVGLVIRTRHPDIGTLRAELKNCSAFVGHGPAPLPLQMAVRRSLGVFIMTEAKAAKKPNPALAKPLQPSNELAAVVGSAPLPRTEVVSKVWEYIKANNLQNPANKREILADDKLRPVFGGKDKVSMFEMNKHFAQHLS